MKNITNMVKILWLWLPPLSVSEQNYSTIGWTRKEMDAKIEEKVNEALAKREENEDEEES